MIVPRNRLLFWTGLIIVPFSALGTLFPETGPGSAAAVGLFLAVILFDAVASRGRLDGVRVEFPDVIRMIKDREGGIELRVANSGPEIRQLRLGLAFPRDMHPSGDELLVEPAGGGLTSLFRWTCTPRRRGRTGFSVCYLETPSPAGFWAVRRAVPVRFEVRVYPNLLNERRKLAALFLNRGDAGAFLTRQGGQGREFEKLREYVHGDTYEHIHWKTTAKRGRPVTKLFQVERTQEVYVIVDASRLSGRPVRAAGPEENGSGGTLLERFITAALVMGVAAERQGDLFGVATFSDSVHRFVRAKTGRAHYTACRDAIYGLQPRTVTPDYDEICSFLGMRLRRRALLVFLTSLDDPLLAESFERNMDLLRKRHLVLIGMLRPDDAHPVFSRPDRGSLDDLYRHLAGHLLWRDLRELEKVLRRRGVRFFLLDNERMCPQLVSRYQEVKQGQLV